MELLRQRNTTTNITFPLISLSANPAYNTAALTNITKNIYVWANSTTVPVSATIASNPTQLGTNTGLWYMTLSAAEISSTSYDHMMISLSASQIIQQSILIHFTNYDITQLASTANAVTVGTNNDKTNYTVSAYTNFPQVYVSAGQVTNVTGNVSGSVNNVVVPQSITVGEVTVSAYKNFPQVTVSAQTNHPTVAVSAYTNFPQVQVSGMNSGTIVTATFGSGAINAAAIATDAIGSAELAATAVTKIWAAVPQMTVSALTTAANIGITSSTNYQDGVWIDTLSGVAGTVIGVNGIYVNPSRSYGNALTIANAINVKRFQFRPDSSITLSANSDYWRFIGRAYLSLGGQSINDAVFENLETISGTSTGKDAVFDDCTIRDITVDTSEFHDCNFRGTFTTITNGIYNLKNCVDADPAGLIAPTFVCTPSATIAFRNYHGGVQINAMSADNSIKLDGMGRVVIDSTCSGGDLTVRGFWQITDNASGRVTITSSARYDNNVTVANFPQVQVSGINTGVYGSVSAYTNFPQVYASAGNITTTVGQVQVSGINGGIFVGTSAYTNFPQVYVSANGDKTGYSITANTDKTGYTSNVTSPVIVSAYQNFPQVYVSAGQVTNVTGNISGSVASVVGGVIVTTNNDKTGYSVTAQTNHPAYPAMSVSSVSDKTGYSITANSDKTGYTVTAGSITNVTGNVSGSVNNLVVNPTMTVGEVTVSAYKNFPQVYVSAGQVTNVTGNVSGSVNNLVVNPTMTVGQVTVSAYNNFPQVTVSANLDKANYSISGTKKILDDLNDIDGTDVTATSIPAVSVTVGEVTVSAYKNFPQVYVSGGSIEATVGEVTVSAYKNFPQVYVSAGQVTNVTGNISGSVNSVVGNVGGSVTSVTNPVTVGTNNDKTNYTISGGTVTSVTNPVTVNGSITVSAYQNFPQVYVSANGDKTGYSVISIPEVQVSGINALVINTIQNNLASATQVSNVQNTSNAISAVTNQFTFSGSNVNAYSVNEIIIGDVIVSAFDPYAISQVQNGLASATDLANVQNTINQISADTYYLKNNPLSADIVWVNGVPVQLIDFKNTQTEIYNATSSAVNIELSSSNIVTTTDLANTSAAIVQHGDSNWISSAAIGLDIISAGALLAIDDRFTFSGSLVLSLASSAHINAQEVVDAILSTVIDTKTFEETLEILLAMAQGKITRSNNRFTYYKTNGTTALYTLESERNERNRL